MVPVEPKVFDFLAYLVKNRERAESKDGHSSTPKSRLSSTSPYKLDDSREDH